MNRKLTGGPDHKPQNSAEIFDDALRFFSQFWLLAREPIDYHTPLLVEIATKDITGPGPCPKTVRIDVGDISTVAGGIIGDGGLATDASLTFPRGIALDASGNLA